MNLEEFFEPPIVIPRDADWSCWSKGCNNKATKYAHSRLVYLQICDEHFNDWKDLSDIWKKGINPSRQNMTYSEE